MSDITAVVLTLGEETTARAIRSIGAQSRPAAETVVVSDKTPFHAAFNDGASRVRTEFFVQVDSDMILDSDCFEELRNCVGDRVGIVAGHLRDPLLGRISGVKLFRTECVKKTPFKDSISPDTDFAREIFQDGWGLIYALKFKGYSPELWHTFGEHRPEYTPSYAFTKHLLEGRRYRHRRDLGGYLWHLGRLGKSAHPCAAVAAVAMARGLFIEEKNDLLSRTRTHPDFAFLERLLIDCRKRRISLLAMGMTTAADPRKAFEYSFRLGMNLKKEKVCPDFHRYLGDLADKGLRFLWPTFVGLCHGVFVKKFSRRQIDNDYQKLTDLLPEASKNKFWIDAWKALISKTTGKRGSA